MRSILLFGLIAPILVAARQDPPAATVDPILRRCATAQRALICLAPDADLPKIDGVVFGGRSGDVVTASIEAAGALDRLAACAGVVRVASDPPVRPHNDTAQASTIGFRGDISTGGEIDTYTFEATPGQTVRVRVHAEAALDPFLAIPDGAPPTDDNSGPGSDAELTVAWTSGGSQPIAVSGAGGTTGAYLLIITSSTPILPGVLTGGDIGVSSAHVGGTRAREARTIEGLDGSGVVIGIIDTGIDFKHEDFKTAAGSTRLLAIWDHTLTVQAGEHAPDVGADGNPSNDYGVEYTEAEINDELSGATTGFVRQQDTGGHGTHVAGIAAGDGSSSGAGYIGAAPGARLIIVKHGGTVSKVVDGMSYILKKASELGYPAVIVNLSLGTHDGPHDGTSPFDQAVAGAVSRGRYVVCSVGNEGATRLHAKRTIASSYAFTFTSSSSAPLPAAPHSADFWAPGKDFYNISVTAGTDTISAVSGTSVNSGPLGPGLQKEIRIDNRTDSPANGATHIRISLNDAAPTAWTLTFTRVGFGGTGVVDGWNPSETGTFAVSDITANADGSIPGTVSEPATAPAAVSCGAYREKFAWETSVAGRTAKADGIGASVAGNIAGFSSRGPTRDGRTKPDITAPGAYVASSRSANTTPAAADMDFDTVHTYLQGTSMAAPQVAGILALLLQKNNLFEVNEAKSVMASTALVDGFVQVDSNWGSGKIDAIGLLAMIPRRVDVEASTGVCFKGGSGGSWGAAVAILAAFLLLLRRRCTLP